MIDLTTMTARKIADSVRRRELTAVAVAQVGPGSDRAAERHSARLHHGDARRGDRRGRAGGPASRRGPGRCACHWPACRWRSRTASGPRASARRAARRSSPTSSRPRTRPRWPGSGRPAACWSASPRCTRWPTASPAGTRITATATTPGTRPGSRAGAAAATARRWRRGWHSPRSAATPAARTASRRRSAGSSA